MDLTTYGINRKSGKSIGESLKAQWDEIAGGFSAEAIAASADAAKNYWLKDVPNAFWGVLGFADAKDAAQKVTEFFTNRNDNADAATRLSTGADWRPSYMGGGGTGTTNAEVTQQSMNTFANVVAEKISGMAIYMDGAKVGEITADTVGDVLGIMTMNE